MQVIRFIQADILTAFSDRSVGTRVVDPDSFWSVLAEAVGRHDPSGDRQDGQHFVVLEEAKHTVSCGEGKATRKPDDYVLRQWRGKVQPFLRREKAEPCTFLACVVYTREAYLSDPDVQGDARETDRVEASDASHVLVAVIAAAGPQAPLSPDRLVSNLAGGNKEALTWSADEIRAKAQATKEYWDEWSIVAD